MFKRLCASVASIDSGAANECCPARLRIAQIISRHQPASAAQPSNRQYKLLMHVINKVFYKVIVNNLFGKRVQGFHKFYQISNPNILRDRAGLLRNSSKSAMQWCLRVPDCEGGGVDSLLLLLALRAAHHRRGRGQLHLPGHEPAQQASDEGHY